MQDERSIQQQSFFKKETYKVASNPAVLPKYSGQLHVLFTGESQTKPNHRLGPKIYDFYLMHIVLAGKGTFTTENGKYHLNQGDTFLIRPEQLIAYESDAENPWHYRWIAFKGEKEHIEQILATAGFDDEHEYISTSYFTKISRCYSTILEAFKRGESISSIKAVGLLYLIMAEYGRKQNRLAKLEVNHQHEKQKIYKQIVHYLSTQYTHPVSIEDMAETLGYNRAYLSRLFKKKTGSSPTEFLLKLRLDKARLMLRERPELTIEQISASVGIQDALYFSKQFKKWYSVSPSTYRKRMTDPEHM